VYLSRSQTQTKLCDIFATFFPIPYRDLIRRKKCFGVIGTLTDLETRTPGRERTSVRAGDLNDLSSSWGVVYLLYSFKIIRKSI